MSLSNSQFTLNIEEIVKGNIPENFFEMWWKVDQEVKIKFVEKMNLRLLRKLADVWLKSSRKSKSLRMKEGNEVNTFATVISGYESYRVQFDLFPKLGDTINQTEIANKDRKPGYLVIPAHAGKGKTRTLGEIVKAAMQNGLQGPLSKSLNNKTKRNYQNANLPTKSVSTTFPGLVPSLNLMNIGSLVIWSFPLMPVKARQGLWERL